MLLTFEICDTDILALSCLSLFIFVTHYVNTAVLT